MITKVADAILTLSTLQFRKFNSQFGGLTVEKLLPKPLLSLLSPWTSTYAKLATKSTHEVLSTIIKNEELINLLTYLWGDNGLPPRESSFAIHAIIANHYFSGAGYPIGGSGQLAEHIIPSESFHISYFNEQCSTN